MKNKKAKDSNSIVDLKSISNSLISELWKCREERSGNVSRITNRETQLAKKAIAQLLRGKKVDGELITITGTTFNRYITRLRTQIRESGLKHPIYEKQLLKLADSNKKYKKRIVEIAEAPYRDSKRLMALLVEDLKQKESTLKTKKSKEAAKALRVQLSDKIAKVIDPAILKHLTRNDEQHSERKADAVERIEKYQDSDTDIQYEYSEIMALIPDLLTRRMGDSVWAEVALGVGLATGRRSYEIFYLSDFSQVKKQVKKQVKNQFISVSGFAKKRSLEESEQVIKIPCLADPKLVIDAVNFLRNHSRVSGVIERADLEVGYDAKNLTIQNSIHKQANIVASEVLGRLLSDKDGNELLDNSGDYSKGVPFKISRDLYVNCAYQEYKANGGTHKIDRFTRDNLHHESMGTAVSYKKLQAKSEIEELDVKKARSVKIKKDNRGKDRLAALVEFSNSEVVTASKPYKKAMDWIIEKVKEDNSFKATNSSLRKAVPNGKGGLKPIISPLLCGKLVELLKAENLDSVN